MVNSEELLLPQWGRLASCLEAEYFVTFAKCGGEVRRFGESVFAGVTGRESNDRNGIVAGIGASSEEVVQAIDWVQNHNVPASLFCVPGPASADLLKTLRACGLVPEQSAVGMGVLVEEVRDVEKPESAKSVELLQVQTEKDVNCWLDIAEAAGWLSDRQTSKDRRILKHHIGELARQKRARYCVAELEGKPVGMSGAFLHRGSALLTDLATLPDYQRMGIGSAIMSSWFEYCHSQRVKELLLFPTAEGKRLYQKHGMVEFPLPRDTVFYLNRAG